MNIFAQGVTTGALLCKLLREKYGNDSGCQGIGGGYSASIGDNMLPKGTAEASIKSAIETLTEARTKCPKSVVVFEGYRYDIAASRHIRSTSSGKC
jgi:cutinase